MIVRLNLGGAIVGLPFAFYHLGIPMGTIILIFIAFLCYKSCQMYLSLKELCPGRLTSLYGFGYMLMGRKSVFIISFVELFHYVCLIMIEIIVFSEVS